MSKSSQPPRSKKKTEGKEGSRENRISPQSPPLNNEPNMTDKSGHEMRTDTIAVRQFSVIPPISTDAKNTPNKRMPLEKLKENIDEQEECIKKQEKMINVQEENITEERKRIEQMKTNKKKHQSDNSMTTRNHKERKIEGERVKNETQSPQGLGNVDDGRSDKKVNTNMPQDKKNEAKKLMDKTQSPGGQETLEENRTHSNVNTNQQNYEINEGIKPLNKSQSPQLTAHMDKKNENEHGRVEEKDKLDRAEKLIDTLKELKTSIDEQNKFINDQIIEHQIKEIEETLKNLEMQEQNIKQQKKIIKQQFENIDKQRENIAKLEKNKNNDQPNIGQQEKKKKNKTEQPTTNTGQQEKRVYNVEDSCNLMIFAVQLAIMVYGTYVVAWSNLTKDSKTCDRLEALNFVNASSSFTCKTKDVRKEIEFVMDVGVSVLCTEFVYFWICVILSLVHVSSKKLLCYHFCQFISHALFAVLAIAFACLLVEKFLELKNFDITQDDSDYSVFRRSMLDSLTKTYTSDNISSKNTLSDRWNKFFIKYDCCAVNQVMGTTNDFDTTPWCTTSGSCQLTNSQIPKTCCKDVSEDNYQTAPTTCHAGVNTGTYKDSCLNRVMSLSDVSLNYNNIYELCTVVLSLAIMKMIATPLVVCKSGISFKSFWDTWKRRG